MADVNLHEQSDTQAMQNPAGQNPLEQLLFYVGSAALLAVIAVEALSVLGRHVSLPLIGAIEIIQALILIAACASTVFATLRAAHATVRLLTNRMSTTVQRRLSQVNAVLAALFFAGLAIGSFWLARDFWNAYEESELLHISYRPLRAIATLSALSTMMIFLYGILQREKQR